MIHLVVYEYRFTTPDERRRTHAWWDRKPVAYLPVPLTGADIPPAGAR
jgi:hypothetical protein